MNSAVEGLALVPGKKTLSKQQQNLVQREGLDKVVVFSQAMQQIVAQALCYHHDRAIPVLISGETGTGKELVAKIIHFAGLEEDRPFVDINCAAFSPNLFETEMFGYEGGSFTGSETKGHEGKLDLAQGGTLFLDEISELAPELQSKLLRVIQEKHFYRVGGLKKITADIRIICATNTNLEQLVEKGQFRRDLYYRLKVGRITIPPLRERKADIMPLAQMFLYNFARDKHKKFATISDAAAKLLLDYCWPGNVRELRNAIELAVFMHNDSKLQPQHLSLITDAEGLAPQLVTPESQTFKPLLLPSTGFSLREHIDSIILQAFAMHQGNKTATAQYLGISRRALGYRLAKIKHKKTE